MGFRVGAQGCCGAQINAGVVLDDQGNYGLYLTETPKELNFTSGASISASGSVALSKAPTISDIEGLGVQVGGSGGFLGKLGLDGFMSPGGANPGSALSFGYGLGVEAHSEYTVTAVMKGGNFNTDAQNIEKAANVAVTNIKETAAGVGVWIKRHIFKDTCTNPQCSTIDFGRQLKNK